MTTVARNERGSVLIIAVIAMLIMGVLSVSFALLANIETTIGYNYKAQAQAEALAEAGLDRARDALRTAAAEPCGFTRWTSSTVVGTCGTALGALLFNNVSLGAGQYSARIDNDCHPLIPTPIEQPAGSVGGAPVAACPDPPTIPGPGGDTNETAVLTAWASAGVGRARVRGIVSIDNPWKHVCSDHKADSGGYCNSQDNENGTPTVQPADPNNPNGPRGYDDLPRPYLGCSRIDPDVHARPGDPPGAQTGHCNANPLMYTYPYPDHLAAGSTPRLVIMGADPNLAGSTAPYCGTDGAGTKYFGYFDCALSTPCPAAVCGAPLGRPACVRLGDPRINGTTYLPTVGGVCPVGATGMVFTSNTNLVDVGDNSTQYTMYFLNSTVTVQSHTVYGTLVVEGNSDGNGCPVGKDAEVKTNGIVWTGPNPETTGPGSQYGYPIAVLIYDPDLADPTPAGVPQGTCSDMGSAGGSGTQIHGLIYSGGEVEFNPISVYGGVIAWSIQTQSTTANYVYKTTYGDASSPAPPGFPTGGGTEVVIVRKSFITCTTYADESGGGTACP